MKLVKQTRTPSFAPTRILAENSPAQAGSLPTPLVSSHGSAWISSTPLTTPPSIL